MTSEKLKGKIKSFSEKNNLKAQEVLQMYFFERFLTRLEKSKYRANFIIKGGFLISSIIGIQNRTTMDIDTTIKGLPVKEEIIKEIILEILNIEVNDEIKPLETTILESIKCLRDCGRLCVITFHSLEDRAVKYRNMKIIDYI